MLNFFKNTSNFITNHPPNLHPPSHSQLKIDKIFFNCATQSDLRPPKKQGQTSLKKQIDFCKHRLFYGFAAISGQKNLFGAFFHHFFCQSSMPNAACSIRICHFVGEFAFWMPISNGRSRRIPAWHFLNGFFWQAQSRPNANVVGEGIDLTFLLVRNNFGL